MSAEAEQFRFPDDRRSVVLLDEDMAPQVGPIAVAAGTIAAWLAQGAVSYLGGKAMASILGDPSLSDVKRWIREAVEELKSYISAELHRQITQQYVDETTDNVDGMRRDLLDYGASKAEQILYEQFGSRMNTWISATTRLGLPVVLVYADAVSLRMLVLSALVKDHRRKQYAPRMLDTATEGASHVDSCIAEHVKWLDQGIASVGPIKLTHQPKFVPNWVAGFDSRAGREAAGDNNRDVAVTKASALRDARLATFERDKDLAIHNFHIPLRVCVENWREAARHAAK